MSVTMLKMMVDDDDGDGDDDDDEEEEDEESSLQNMYLGPIMTALCAEQFGIIDLHMNTHCRHVRSCILCLSIS